MSNAALENVTEKMMRKIAQGPAVNARVKFDFGADGIIFIDATQNPPVISHDDHDADLVLACSLEIFTALLDGKQDPNIAFMMGKLKIKGPMGLAMKLNALLEG